MTTNKQSFKYCIVPECTNTSRNAPEKLFISLPSDKKRRRTWQHAMRRAHFVSDRGTRFCCEDHFNVEQDIENYLYIKTMKCGKIKLKPGVIPHIFDWQKKHFAICTSKPVKELLREISDKEAYVEANIEEEVKILEPTSTDQGVQVNLKPRRKSKAIQCVCNTLLQITSKTR